MADFSSLASIEFVGLSRCLSPLSLSAGFCQDYDEASTLLQSARADSPGGRVVRHFGLACVLV